ncbi:hypothetical protein [uncultured Tenacibaculum sp.]|uniref:hypothetical protein n=1 Tax=uncultured Tenacibaculum sp. TaxID=174713 RepID=UPI00261017F2|nr:hypothetical protein [uncultured Tenacibaculum sp.]
MSHEITLVIDALSLLCPLQFSLGKLFPLAVHLLTCKVVIKTIVLSEIEAPSNVMSLSFGELLSPLELLGKMLSDGLKL